MSRVTRIAPIVAYSALILGASSIPARALPPGGFWSFDKVIHAAVYAVLGALWFRALRDRLAPRHALMLAALATLAMGVCDELYQQLTPGRDSSAGDVLADLFGGSLGALAMMYVSKERRDAAP